MNDLGLTLAWLAVQVALVLGPALALDALVSRRRPLAGAWIPALSLGFVVVLSASAFLPAHAHSGAVPAAQRAPSPPGPGPASASDRGRGPGAEPAAGLTLDLATLARAWARLERGASAPAERCRPWGSALAALALAGTAAGLLHVALGLWAVGLCRRNGTPVEDAEMIALLKTLRGAMRCRPHVGLIEMPDLTTPAMAGWRRPVILLPTGWRSWDDSARRAVLAHELAHVVRRDYAAGLVAQLALALNVFHPLVRWMAARMQLQQELAADALGARHAGGRARYLAALSRLLLDQDGRSPSWPVRAFLPRRGALIRRIAMLRDEETTGTSTPPWSWAGRFATAAGLLGLTIAVGTLRGPAHGAEDPAPAPAQAGGSATTRTVPFPDRSYVDVITDERGRTAGRRREKSAPAPIYIADGKDGAVVFRPAATLRHAKMSSLIMPLITDLAGFDPIQVAHELKVDLARSRALRLNLSDVEWVTASVHFGQVNSPENGKQHSLMLSNPVVCTVSPFDWLAFLRLWRCEVTEVRVANGVYYRIKGPLAELLGPNVSVYLPDDRTLMVNDEATIRKLVGNPPTVPDFLRGADWEGASRGLFAVAVNNQRGQLAQCYDMGRSDDALVLSLFEGVERWIFSVADADPIELSASAACRDRAASDAIVRAIDSLRKLGEDGLAAAVPEVAGNDHLERTHRMAKALLGNLTTIQIDHMAPNGFPPIDNILVARAQHFGTLAEWAALVEGGQNENAGNQGAQKGPKEGKR